VSDETPPLNPRPVVAVISNALTPYRLHFHRRLARELPAFEWWSLFTHDVSNAPWGPADEAEIRPVRFGPGERSDDQSKPSRAWHEYRKGGRVVRWLADHAAAAVILLGYNDASRLRVLRWCHRRGTPCFLFGDSNARGDRTTGLKARVKRWLLPRVLRQCAGVLPCGSLGREYFRRYGVPDDRMFDVPYEPDYGLIAAVTDQQVEAEYHQRGLPVDRDYFLYCGRMVAVKRVDVLIDAFARIAGRRSGWDLLLVGDGPASPTINSWSPGCSAGPR
jgi:glycosyltransferase involved in cell wall biosynthesis